MSDLKKPAKFAGFFVVTDWRKQRFETRPYLNAKGNSASNNTGGVTTKPTFI